MFNVEVDQQPDTLSTELEIRKKLSEMNPVERFNALQLDHN
jgi:hypothetical protein